MTGHEAAADEERGRRLVGRLVGTEVRWSERLPLLLREHRTKVAKSRRGARCRAGALASPATTARASTPAACVRLRVFPSSAQRETTRRDEPDEVCDPPGRLALWHRDGYR